MRSAARWLGGGGGWAVLAGGALVAAVRFASRPATPWEADECLFIQAVERFEPLRHHPHPPGYPLFVALGKALVPVFGDPFAALVAVSSLASLGVFLALAVAFRPLLREALGGDTRSAVVTAACAAALVSLSPAALVHGGLALSDAAALAFSCLALLLAVRCEESPTDWSATAMGVAWAAAVGCRPQLAVAVLPAFAVAVLRAPDRRRRLFALGSFTLTCLAWIVPLVAATDGPARFAAWQLEQASYAARHDAELSRRLFTNPALLARLLAHPWGAKWLSAPVLATALIGAWRLLRARAWPALPVATLAAANAAACLLWFDPADGARYALPTLPFVALAATTGIVWLAGRRAPLVCTMAVAAYGMVAVAYAWPILEARAWGPSPPAAAVAALRAGFTPEAVLVEAPLRPHAELLLRGITWVRVEDGWARPGTSRNERFVLLADRAVPGARVFAWPDWDGYGKLTRGHYRAVSLLPVPASSLYRTVAGVFPIERDDHGLEWRWLGAEARIAVANLGCGSLRLALRNDTESPFAVSTVEVKAAKPVLAELPRGVTRWIEIPLGKEPVVEVVVRGERSFVPAVLGGSADARRLTVQLLGVEQVCR